MEKYNSQKEASIGFFLGVNPKLTLRKALKQKIDEICLWLDFNDEDTKKLMRDITTETNKIQELVIPAFDIYTKNLVKELKTIELHLTFTKSERLQTTQPF